MTELLLSPLDEIWKPVMGYEGHYEVSNMGSIRSIDRYITDKRGFRRLKKSKTKSALGIHGDYKRVYLKVRTQMKMQLVHRMVAQHFVDNPHGLPCVNHIDGNKYNNYSENLEWVSYSQNTRHAISTGLIAQSKKTRVPLEKKAQIQNEYSLGETTYYELAQKNGISMRRICSIVRGS